MSAVRRMSRSLAYPIVGAVLALGAPCGLVIVRCVVAARRPSLEWVLSEVLGDMPGYVYLAVSTTLVFAALGWWLGRKEDALEATAATDPLTGLANRRHLEAG